MDNDNSTDTNGYAYTPVKNITKKNNGNFFQFYTGKPYISYQYFHLVMCEIAKDCLLYENGSRRSLSFLLFHVLFCKIIFLVQTRRLRRFTDTCWKGTGRRPVCETVTGTAYLIWILLAGV